MSGKSSESREGDVPESGADASEELAEERKKNQELLNRLKYAQADLENYRKRVDKEMREAGESSVRSLVTRLLGVLDELELAVKHSEDREQGGELTEGLKMVRRNLWSSLESAGVERIDCVGKAFDPSLHEAVEKVKGGSEGQGLVVEELRPGFTFRGALIRPSMVKVQLASEGPAEEAKASE